MFSTKKWQKILHQKFIAFEPFVRFQFYKKKNASLIFSVETGPFLVPPYANPILGAVYMIPE